jgi:hypothetical protein
VDSETLMKRDESKGRTEQKIREQMLTWKASWIYRKGKTRESEIRLTLALKLTFDVNEFQCRKFCRIDEQANSGEIPFKITTDGFG